MIISEKQIMQLITLLRQNMAILTVLDHRQIKELYNNCENILVDIVNQQSEELKVVE